MTTYYMDEGSFELPDLRFEDRSETVLEIANGASALEVRVQRGPLPGDLAIFTAERSEASKAKLRGCSVVFHRPRAHAEAEVIEVGLRYRGDDGMRYRHEAYLAHGATLFIVTVTGAILDWESVDTAIDCLLGTASARDLRR